MSFHVIIPARYASTRFPGKPLADLGGKPMVVRVCERAAASGADLVAVATDDARIKEAVEQAGYSALMTRADHPSGTDRIAEAAAALQLAPGQVVVNVQGDEPLIDSDLVRQVAKSIEQHPEASVSTACHRIHDPAALSNPNVVKIVLDTNGYALYFSRSQIPYPRASGGTWFRHAGIYGYRVEFLQNYVRLPQSPMEKTEALEQLRVLWHGYRITVVIREEEPETSVDTRQDLILAIKNFSRL